MPVGDVARVVRHKRRPKLMDKPSLRELTEKELDVVSGGVPNEPPYNGNQGSGPGNSGNGDKNGSDVVGPPGTK